MVHDGPLHAFLGLFEHLRKNLERDKRLVSLSYFFYIFATYAIVFALDNENKFGYAECFQWNHLYSSFPAIAAMSRFIFLAMTLATVNVSYFVWKAL